MYKVHELVSDSEFYEEKNKIPVWSLENKANKIAKKLFEKSIINEETKNCLLVSNTIEPKLYAVIKHHKTGFPGRPILTCNQTASEKLSKWASEKLTSVFNQNEYNVTNPWSLRMKLKELHLEKDEIPVSFDAKSLFTNLNRDLIMKILKEKFPQIKMQVSNNLT